MTGRNRQDSSKETSKCTVPITHQRPLNASPRNLQVAGEKAHPSCTLTSFMKVSMTDPTCPYAPLSLPRARLECCGLFRVPLSVLLKSHVALLSPRLPRELLESMGWVSGFSHTPKGSAQSSALQRGPAKAVVWPWRSCFYLSAGLQGPRCPNSCYTTCWVAVKCRPTFDQWPPILLPK